MGKREGGMNLLKLTRENNRTGQLSAGEGLKQESKMMVCVQASPWKNNWINQKAGQLLCWHPQEVSHRRLGRVTEGLISYGACREEENVVVNTEVSKQR